jgi:hypothetical protein
LADDACGVMFGPLKFGGGMFLTCDSFAAHPHSAAQAAYISKRRVIFAILGLNPAAGSRKCHPAIQGIRAV